MGYYIQTPGFNHSKALRIAAQHNGVLISKPNHYSDIPEDSALIVVVDNGPFEAAALAYSEREFEEFTDFTDERPKEYVLLDKEVAHKLAGYPNG